RESALRRFGKLLAEIFGGGDGRIAGRLNVGGLEDHLVLRGSRKGQGAGQTRGAKTYTESRAKLHEIATLHCFLPPGRCRSCPDLFLSLLASRPRPDKSKTNATWICRRAGAVLKLVR